MKISALLFVIFCAVAFATPAFAETQKMTAKVLKGFAKSIYGEEEAPRMMASGKFPCLACTVGMSKAIHRILFISILALVHKQKAGATKEICGWSMNN